MATANAQTISGAPSDDSIFGRIRSITSSFGDFVGAAGSLWQTVSPTWAGGDEPPPRGTQSAPTFQGTPGTNPNTTGNVVNQVSAQNNQLLLIGATIVAAIFLFKK